MNDGLAHPFAVFEESDYSNARSLGLSVVCPFRPSGSSTYSGLAHKAVIHRAVGRRLASEHANHADDLPAMHDGMIENMPQDFPARKVPLNFAGKLQIQLDPQTALGLVFEPSAEADPELRPPLPEKVE